MKRTTTLAIITLISLAAARHPTLGAQTNLVQNINIKFTAYTEGDTTTNKSVINTPVLRVNGAARDIIEILGEATGNSFSPRARLVLVTPLDGEDSSIFVRDGVNAVDVSDFFSYDFSSSHVQALQTNTVSHVEKATDYRLVEFAMHDNGGQVLGARFDVAGLAVDKSASIVKSGVVLAKSHQIMANALSGTGDFTDDLGAHFMIVQINLTVTGNTLEVQ